MCYINVRSVKNKTTYLFDYITSHNYDIFAICETWLNCKATNDVYINALLPPGYTIHHVDRDNEATGGGVAIIHKQCLNIKLCVNVKFTQFECLQCTLKVGNTDTDLIVFYRPPPSPVNKLTTHQFLSEWEEFMSHCAISISELVIMGDANLHLDDMTLRNTKIFLHILESSGLQQHIHEPTHHLGHTLDVIISRDTRIILTDVEVVDIGLCNENGVTIRDHYAVTSTLKHAMPRAAKKLVNYRKLQSIDIPSFCEDIATSLMNTTTGTVSELTEKYITGLCSILDEHAPLIQRRVTERPNTPWYNEQIRDAKRLRRRLENKWRDTKLMSSHKAYRKQCSVVAKELYNGKLDYYSSKIKETRGDNKALFRITHSLLSVNHKEQLPNCKDDRILANQFACFFEDKIENIRKNFIIHNHSDETPKTTPHLRDLNPASRGEVREVILSSPDKTCDLDPIPTWLLKKCIDQLLPIITAIINSSMSSGCFPDELKSAIIRPHLKKTNTDADELMNYRPVSNLHFISKVLES